MIEPAYDAHTRKHPVPHGLLGSIGSWSARQRDIYIELTPIGREPQTSPNGLVETVRNTKEVEI